MEEYHSTKGSRYNRRTCSRGQKVKVELPNKKNTILKQIYWKKRTKKAIHMARNNKYLNVCIDNDFVDENEKKNNYNAWEIHINFLEQQNNMITNI